ELSSGWNSHVGEIEQQAAGDAEAVVDVERIVKMRVVDEALPADRGARLLKIDAHDDEHVILEALCFHLELGGVFERRFGIMDRAGADDSEQPVIIAAENG